MDFAERRHIPLKDSTFLLVIYTTIRGSSSIEWGGCDDDDDNDNDDDGGGGRGGGDHHRMMSALRFRQVKCEIKPYFGMKIHAYA